MSTPSNNPMNAELQQAMTRLAAADRHLDAVTVAHARALGGGYLTAALEERLAKAKVEHGTRVKLALLAYGDSPAALPFAVDEAGVQP